MKACTARLKSVAAYSQSRAHDTPKQEKEGHDDYERRTWREKCHYDENGEIFIPGMAFKMAVDRAATFLGMKIPGRRNATYSKHFLAGVLVLDNVPLGIHKDDAVEQRLYVNSDGVRGSGKRVWRHFPVIPEWEADVTFHIVDDTISKDIFEAHLIEAGKFIGIGRFRPEKGGFNGRFQVVATSWE